MAPKVFLTGVTGYVGGQVFADLYKVHPDWDYTLIVRNEDRGKPVAEKYPKVRLVYGTNESADVIEKEAAAADIVIHTAESADDVPSAKAIAKGLAAGHTAENPGFWIHLSGTGILTWYDNDNKRFGEAPLPEQEYNDIQGIDKIVNLPDSAMHRNVDKIVLAANSDAVRTAIVAPPTIYGPGQGPVNTRSQQLPNLAKFTLEKGYAPIVGAGLTEWDNVHVRDLGPLWVALADATQNPVKSADPEIFGPRAYYFARAAVHRWADLAKGVAEMAHKRGYLPAPLTKSVQIKEVADGSLGANSKGVPERAAKYLGWKPKEPGIGEFFGTAVDVEADRLQLVPHEQAKA